MTEILLTTSTRGSNHRRGVIAGVQEYLYDFSSAVPALLRRPALHPNHQGKKRGADHYRNQKSAQVRPPGKTDLKSIYVIMALVEGEKLVTIAHRCCSNCSIPWAAFEPRDSAKKPSTVCANCESNSSAMVITSTSIWLKSMVFKLR